MSATAVAYALKLGWAISVFYLGGGRNVATLLEERQVGSTRLPALTLAFVPGACSACCDALSFLSLAELDPVSYQVILHLRLVLMTLLWRLVLHRQLTLARWFVLLLFTIAGATKALELEGANRALSLVLLQALVAAGGNAASEFLLTNLSMPSDLLDACLYFQGIMGLLVVACAVQGGPASLALAVFATDGWRELLTDQWLMGSACCLAAFGLAATRALRELPVSLKDLCTGSVVAATAAIEWGTMSAAPCTVLSLQAVVLVLLALGLYATDPPTDVDSVAAKLESAPLK